MNCVTALTDPVVPGTSQPRARISKVAAWLQWLLLENVYVHALPDGVPVEAARHWGLALETQDVPLYQRFDTPHAPLDTAIWTAATALTASAAVPLMVRTLLRYCGLAAVGVARRTVGPTLSKVKVLPRTAKKPSSLAGTAS